MSPFRLLPTFAISALSILIIATTSSGLKAAPKAVANKNGHHLDHLHKAAQELKHAHSAVNGKAGKKVGNAAQHVTSAISHIEAAIKEHKPQLEQNRFGVAGAATTAIHHHHHNQLHEALKAAKAAEKQIASGNAAGASADITKAHRHVELAMHSHRAVIGK